MPHAPHVEATSRPVEGEITNDVEILKEINQEPEIQQEPDADHHQHPPVTTNEGPPKEGIVTPSEAVQTLSDTITNTPLQNSHVTCSNTIITTSFHSSLNHTFGGTNTTPQKSHNLIFGKTTNITPLQNNNYSTGTPLQNSCYLSFDRTAITTTSIQKSCNLTIDTSIPLQNTNCHSLGTSTPLQNSNHHSIGTTTPLQNSNHHYHSLGTATPLQNGSHRFLGTTTPLQVSNPQTIGITTPLQISNPQTAGITTSLQISNPQTIGNTSTTPIQNNQYPILRNVVTSLPFQNNCHNLDDSTDTLEKCVCAVAAEDSTNVSFVESSDDYQPASPESDKRIAYDYQPASPDDYQPASPESDKGSPIIINVSVDENGEDEDSSADVAAEDSTNVSLERDFSTGEITLKIKSKPVSLKEKLMMTALRTAELRLKSEEIRIQYEKCRLEREKLELMKLKMECKQLGLIGTE